MERDLGIAAQQKISAETFNKLADFRKRHSEAKSQRSPETSPIFGSWCRFFLHAIREGRRCSDLEGLERLKGLSPETKETSRKLAAAVTDITNAAGNKEAARVLATRIVSSAQTVALA